MEEDISLKGSNFLVSAVMMLRRQRRDLEKEVKNLKERMQLLEKQNAALVNLGADRLLEKLG